MYCPNCGERIPDGSKYCPVCGAPVSGDINSRGTYGNAPAYNNDSGSFGWAVLGFFIPLVGLILYLVWKDEKPKSAKRAGKGALVSVIIYVIIMVIYLIVMFAALGSVVSSVNDMAVAAFI